MTKSEARAHFGLRPDEAVALEGILSLRRYCEDRLASRLGDSEDRQQLRVDLAACEALLRKE